MTAVIVLYKNNVWTYATRLVFCMFVFVCANLLIDPIKSDYVAKET
jgi:hypothetical protein